VGGNATVENNANAVTRGAKDHGSDGILQWRLGRLTDLQRWATQNFGRWDTLEAQAAFTLYETARDYPQLDIELRKDLKGVPDNLIYQVLDYKTDRFCRVFERPNMALAHMDKRKRAAQNIFNMYRTVDNAKGAVVIGGAAGTGAVVNHTSGGPPEVSIALGIFWLINWLISLIPPSLTREVPEERESEVPTDAPLVPSSQVLFSPLENYKQKLDLLKQAQIEADKARKVLVEYSSEVTDLLASVDLKIIEHQPALGESHGKPTE
jgi:hypothetical protein